VLFPEGVKADFAEQKLAVACDTVILLYGKFTAPPTPFLTVGINQPAGAKAWMSYSSIRLTSNTKYASLPADGGFGKRICLSLYFI